MTAGQLQKALDRAGMSQRGAAKEMGISERQMRRYCSGEAKVPRLIELAMTYQAAIGKACEDLRRCTTVAYQSDDARSLDRAMDKVSDGVSAVIAELSKVTALQREVKP